MSRVFIPNYIRAKHKRKIKRKKKEGYEQIKASIIKQIVQKSI